ncbi:hypothetical protein, partial [Mesorhizobium sp.]|uniref:hypothetical protein n=2 Tax=Mesorhizobium sp. TaxID=1871066 RepID=UPI0025ED7AD6
GDEGDQRRRCRMSAAPSRHCGRKHVTVYDTTSQLGGSFTVSIVETLAGNAVKVRVWYGRATAQGWEAWKDWDGYTFQTDRAALTNERIMPLFK